MLSTAEGSGTSGERPVPQVNQERCRVKTNYYGPSWLDQVPQPEVQYHYIETFDRYDNTNAGYRVSSDRAGIGSLS